MTADDQFSLRVRHALRHLYDPVALEASALIQVFGLSETPSPGASLRRLIIQQIHAMEPDPDTPDTSPLWAIYEALLLRYVQQCSQLEVADQLGLSERHLRRRESQAITILAQRLRERLTPDMDAVMTLEDKERRKDPFAARKDLAWLKEPPVSGPVSLSQTMASALLLVRPLAESHRVKLSIKPLADLPLVAVHPVGLHQIVVSLLSAAVRWVGCTEVSLDAETDERGVVLVLQAGGEGANETPDETLERCLGIVRELVEAVGGSYAAWTHGGELATTIVLPAAREVPLIVVDDNQDVIELMQRYASDTPYRVYGVTYIEEVAALAQRVGPRAVLLDVMMPGVGGWEVLGRLKHHPATRGVPVIVCTILPEAELASSLGADGFLQKPFTRDGFLSALAQLLDREEPTPG